MSGPPIPPELDPATQRQLAAGLYNQDWDRPAAYEALARALAVAGDRTEAEAWRARAREALTSVAEAEDRELIEGDLATLPLG